MARTIYINTDNGSIESAPVAGLNRPSARVPLREIVAGTTETYNLYLVKSDGTYDSRSGSGAVSVNVAIGQRGQTATSGNFTITDSAATTSAEISATASAQAVEDALNAMNSGAGIASNTVYLSTNGTTDKAINADCSEAGASTYKITGKIRSSTTGIKYCEISGEALTYNLTVSDEWIDFETNTSNSIIPDEVIVGYALFGQPPFEVERFSEADWFDVRLINTITGETVAYWPLNEQSSGSLNGVTATDSVGGYDGTYIGCTGGSEYIAGVLNASLIDVTKLGSGIWLATWRENGARTVLTGASVDLTPESVVVPSISVTGDASSKCQQLIEVNRQPAIFQDTWSTITNGFSGTLDADVGRIVQALSDGQSIEFYFEVRIDDDAICSTPIRVLAPVGGAASVSSAAPYGGTLASDPANYPGFDADAWNTALDTTLYGQLYFSATVATTIAVAGTYVKLAGTTTSDSLNGITMPQNNRLQNNSGTTRVFQAIARTDIIDGSGNKNLGIKLAKNGVLIDPTESHGETTNNVAAHVTINWIVSLASGEYVEIWATNESDTSSITAQHGHLFLKAID